MQMQHKQIDYGKKLIALSEVEVFFPSSFESLLITRKNYPSPNLCKTYHANVTQTTVRT